MKKNIEKNKKGHFILKFFLFIILMIVLFVAGFVGYSTYKNGWGVKGIVQTVIGQDKEKLKDLDPFTVLILGVSEDIKVSLTDTIIIASYNPKTQKATLISVPRDTFVGKSKINTSSYDKINALYQTSPEKTLMAVNKITGLDIKYYVVVSNNALVKLVDTIGGVEYDVPIDMDYDDSSQDLYIHLEKGYQKLNGQQAEWLVRFRKNNNGTSYPTSYGDNDIGRMKTQREFLKTLAKQLFQVKNITKLKELIDIFKENVKTNINNWSLIKDYIPYLIDFNTEDLQTETIPGNPEMLGKLWFFVHNQKETIKLINEVMEEQNSEEEDISDDKNINNIENTISNENKNSTKNTITSSKEENVKKEQYKIELLNGSQSPEKLEKALNSLKESGFNVYKTGTTTSTSKTTIINKKKISNDQLTKIKNILGVGNISTSSSSASTVDITIILGLDYK